MGAWGVTAFWVKPVEQNQKTFLIGYSRSLSEHFSPQTT